jgi:hypothetical protein
MFDRQKGLYRSPEGAPGGTGATPEPSAAAAAAGASGQPPAAGSGDGAAAFDWSKQGLDNDAMALVNDRQWKGIPDVLSSYRNWKNLRVPARADSSNCPVIKIPWNHGARSTTVSVDRRRQR